MKGRKQQVGSPSSNSEPGKEQDRFLPIANVSRIMKRSLPSSAKISKEAKETVQECVSEFISFITGEASEKCQREKRKTINGDDLLWAMTTLGFENYVRPLKLYLNSCRQTEGEEKSSMARSPSEEGSYSQSSERQIDDPVAARTSFANDNGRLYPAEIPVAPVCFGGGGGRDVGYGNQFGFSGLGMGRSSEAGGADGGNALASYLHGGVEW